MVELSGRDHPCGTVGREGGRPAGQQLGGFSSSAYRSSIAKDAAVGASVDTGSPTNDGGDTLTYSITAGNGEREVQRQQHRRHHHSGRPGPRVQLDDFMDPDRIVIAVSWLIDNQEAATRRQRQYPRRLRKSETHEGEIFLPAGPLTRTSRQDMPEPEGKRRIPTNWTMCCRSPRKARARCIWLKFRPTALESQFAGNHSPRYNQCP